MRLNLLNFAFRIKNGVCKIALYAAVYAFGKFQVWDLEKVLMDFLSILSVNGYSFQLARHCCRALSEEQKAEEILRLLPLVTPFTDNFNSLKLAIGTALDRLAQMENIQRVRRSQGGAPLTVRYLSDDTLKIFFNFFLSCISMLE